MAKRFLWSVKTPQLSEEMCPKLITLPRYYRWRLRRSQLASPIWPAIFLHCPSCHLGEFKRCGISRFSPNPECSVWNPFLYNF